MVCITKILFEIAVIFGMGEIVTSFLSKMLFYYKKRSMPGIQLPEILTTSSFWP
jgi:hypothetical protein